LNHPKGYRHKAASDEAKAPQTSIIIWAGVGVIALLAVIGQCSSSNTGGSTATEASNTAQAAISEAIAIQAPPPVLALKGSSVKGGEANLKKVAVEGLPGEMIYSQNCYDALGRHFSWNKLDICGAFDMAAVRDLGDSDATGFAKETAWFENETAAGRYLKAAVAAGETEESADQRLSDLQDRIVKSSAAEKPEPIPADAVNDEENDSDTDSSAVMNT
jgi:predicted RNase H-like HicB family nuclease